MKTWALPLIPILCLSSPGYANAPSGSAASMKNDSTFANLKGEVLLDNDRVHVQRIVVKPGQSTGAHAHADPQLLIFVKGGKLTGTHGHSAIWKDGRVQWFDGSSSAGDSEKNTGAAAIDIVCVTLKPLAPGSAPPAHKVEPLSYPNIPGEDLLENDWVIVQRFVVKPGQWEGVHAHQPNMLYVHIKGGQWAVRSKHEAEHAYPEPSPDGEVGWMDPVDISAGHESGNVGPEPIDLIWVSLKK